MKKNTKIIAAIIVVIMMISIFAITSFAANKVVIKNNGTTRAPIFTTENGTVVFCLERDKIAPSSEGTEYEIISNEEVSSLRTLAINARAITNDSNWETICTYAVWAVLENEVEGYKALTAARFGDLGAETFAKLFAPVEGDFEVQYTIYGSDDEHQKMVSFRVSEVFAEEETEETTVPTTIPETEPETDPEPEQTTVPEPTTEPEPEETTVPDETTTVPEETTVPDETTTIPEETTVPVPEVFATEEVENPHTGGVSTKAAAVAALGIIVILGSAFAAKKVNDKKYDL